MQRLAFFRGLGSNDVRQVQRDSFLRWMIVYPLILAVVLRFALPALTNALAEQFDLSAYYFLVAGYLCLMAPTLIGTVVGFLLLDERDENTLQAQLVTPMPLPTYIGYRVAAPALLSIVQTILIIPLVGVIAVPPLQLLLVALAAGIFAPSVALFYAAFSANKVHGFAMMKIIGVLGLLPVLLYFVPMPWQDLVGIIFPPFWVVKAFWIAVAGVAGTFWLYLLLGVVLETVLLLWLARRFQRIAYT